MHEIPKFDQLRIKTDKELLYLVRKDLDLGLNTACRALMLADGGISVSESYAKTKRSYAKASRWLGLIDEITAQERAELELNLNRLAAILKGLAVLSSAETPGQNDIAALALAFWHARGCPEGSSERDWLRAEHTLGERSSSSNCVLA